MLKVNALMLSVIMLFSSALPLIQAAATDESINLENYKDFVGKSAYTILGIQSKNPGEALAQYSRLADTLDPRHHRGKKEEGAAIEAWDLVRKAYWQLQYPGKSHDYQMKLADLEGHTWKPTGTRTRRSDQSSPHFYTPHIDEGDWQQIRDLEIIESLLWGGKRNLDVTYTVQLLARAIMENHRAILQLQGKPEQEYSEHPEFEVGD